MNLIIESIDKISKDITTVVSAMSITLIKMGKITAQQAGEALVEVSKYLEEN